MLARLLRRPRGKLCYGFRELMKFGNRTAKRSDAGIIVAEDDDRNAFKTGTEYAFATHIKVVGINRRIHSNSPQVDDLCGPTENRPAQDLVPIGIKFRSKMSKNRIAYLSENDFTGFHIGRGQWVRNQMSLRGINR